MPLTLADRLLRLLSEQPESLTSAWDVPRSASLPGLSERLGVVRSALHPHLKHLQESGLILTRQTHVINGGSRKRTVVHPTTEGRRRAASFTEKMAKSQGEIVGSAPERVDLVGRDAMVTDIFERLISGETLVLTGLAGIGKTSLLREAAHHAIVEGHRIRWAQLNMDSDIRSIGHDLFGTGGPENRDAIVGMLDAEDIVIIDGLHELHPRHKDSALELILRITERGRTSIACRAPVPDILRELSVIKVEGLTPENAAKMLSDDMDYEEALRLAEALGGHPLALALLDPNSEAPITTTAVHDFVQQNVLVSLDERCHDVLDRVALEPVPLRGNEIEDEEGFVDLDERALLRWQSNFFGIETLIATVRMSDWPLDERVKIHRELAMQWAERSGGRARRIEMHHRIRSEENNLADILLPVLDEISEVIPSASIILVEDALEASGGDERLRFEAARLSLERAEYDVAESHLQILPENPMNDILRSRILRVQGDSSAADTLESSAIEQMDEEARIRFTLSSIVRRIDDWIPTLKRREDANLLLDAVDAFDSSLKPNHALTAGARIANELSRFRLYLDLDDVESAQRVLDRLTAASGTRDPIVRRMRLRLDAHRAQPDDVPMIVARIEAEPDNIERCRLMHSMLDRMLDPPPGLLAGFERSSLLQIPDFTPLGRRLLASRWRLIARTDPSRRVPALREAVHHLQRSECPRAASELIERVHRLI